MTIGYIGLGAMGSALARRLLRSHELLVYDVDPAATERLADDGAEVASSLAELARQCTPVFLCLPTSTHVREVVFGRDGLVHELQPGAVLVDQTTGDPLATRAMAQDLDARRIELVDAPVTGGVAGANAGTIAILVGSSDAQFERLRPLFETISSNIFHAGGTGNGQVIKLVNNMISGVQRLLTQEGMALAAKNGVDPQVAIAILLAGGGRNAYMERSLSQKVLKGNLSVGYTLGLAHKDMQLAQKLGAQSGVPTGFADLATGRLADFIAELGADVEVEMSGLLTERRAGVKYIPGNHRI